MFERYTDEARKVVVLAQDEARRMDHNYVGSEHLLLGLLREKGVGEKVLYSLNVTEDGVRKQVETIVGYGDSEAGTGEAKGSAPFTPRAKKVFEYALREALQLGHNYIGTEYILLGLVRESEGIGARVLSNLGADAEKVRQEVVQRVGGGRGRSYGGSKAESDEDGALTYLTRELHQVHREVHKLQQMNREMLQELSHLRKAVV
jgi:ATP-dependent Clp protease ATP-binding subunit ClpC